jgi:hypothetical protein
MKLILGCNSGGRFATMRSLRSFWSLCERGWISDRKKDIKLLEENERQHWLLYQAFQDLLAIPL